VPPQEDQACIDLYVSPVAGKMFWSMDWSGNHEYLNFINEHQVEFRVGGQGTPIRTCYEQRGSCLYVRGFPRRELRSSSEAPEFRAADQGFLPQGSWLVVEDESTIFDAAGQRRYSSQIVSCQ
jgi:hypothetical protein